MAPASNTINRVVVLLYSLALFLTTMTTTTTIVVHAFRGGLRSTNNKGDQQREEQRQQQRRRQTMTRISSIKPNAERSSRGSTGSLFGNGGNNPLVGGDFSGLFGGNNNDSGNGNNSCSPANLERQAITHIADQSFTYKVTEGTTGTGLNFSDPIIRDTLQLAVFMAYHDVLDDYTSCVGDGAVFNLDSDFFMFGHDQEMWNEQQKQEPATTTRSSSDNVTFDHSFFFVTMNMFCNACQLEQEDCGFAIFEEDIVRQRQDDSNNDECYCRPPSRTSFLSNLNSRLQENPAFEHITIVDVVDIVVEPMPSAVPSR